MILSLTDFQQRLDTAIVLKCCEEEALETAEPRGLCGRQLCGWIAPAVLQESLDQQDPVPESPRDPG